MIKKVSNNHKNQGLTYLKHVAQLIPSPFYWLDLNQKYLGVNDLVLQGTGTRSYEEDFFEKTPYDIYSEEIAKDIVSHHKEVIKTRKTLSVEETINDHANKTRYVNAVIAPLYDDDKNIIGTIGISIDITAEKEAARLTLETELQKKQIEEQSKFKTVAGQAVHDMGSPIASLLILLEVCKNDVPESVRIALREATSRIRDIAGSLLSSFNVKNSDTEKSQAVLVSLAISEVLRDKKFQFKNSMVEFCDNLGQVHDFGFVEINPSSFARMLSNLINNSVDAFDGTAGVVSLELFLEEKQVRVDVCDDGKGMSEDVVRKILSQTRVSANKTFGHGLGMGQVYDTLKESGGELGIHSVVNEGTRVSLIFPRVPIPHWFASEVFLEKGDTVVVLDDDPSIHLAWDTRFGMLDESFCLKHFTLGREAIDFVNSFEDKDNLLLLTDFELLKQDLNGIDVVEQTGVKRSVLVTSYYANEEVRELALASGVRILPKQLASQVPVLVAGERKTDLVFIDDNESFLDSLILLFSDKAVDTYCDPFVFLENLSKYDKDTPICTDHSLNCEIDGFDVARRLHEAGFSRLFLLSGWEDIKEAPSYLTVVSKPDVVNLKNVL